ncbi:pre-mRNA-processing factor 39 isoform X1 [Xenopus laevis]|uniref:Pre-mRNA-processing factor 39 n=1 Tax=Xenopus laevis TaxID=8355 RepID=A0A8J0UUW9_XENLA|nr:pre-mRNA-processing factor 39 isoform X1 [Xenopus laevis]
MATDWRLPKAVCAEAEIPFTTEESDDEGEPIVPKEPELAPEFKVLWQEATENPYNFNGWTKVLEYVETANNLAAGRKVYDAFLTRFPYCYGYWKKYADLELQFHNTTETEEVYSRALQSIPLSLDLWINYIAFLNNSLDTTLPETTEKLQGAFRSGAAAAGMEFRSDKFWEMYIEWETRQGNLARATAVYDQVLSIPTQLYRQHHERFSQHVSTNSPHELLSQEEYKWICSKIKADGENDQLAAEDSPSGDDQENPEDATDPELQSKIKAQVLTIRDQLFLLNEAEVRKRWNYEEAITRPYFHATPLDHTQLQNWRKYLEFEISQGRHERIVTLYERCLVACALYEEFWLAYVQYMEPHSIEAARCILQRACCIHLPLKPTLSLHWSAFEEKHGQTNTSRSILRDLENLMPGLAMVRLRRVSLERRTGNLEEAERLLEEAVENSLGTDLAAFYSIKLARLLLKLQGNTEKARKVLTEALEREPDNPRLHFCLLELEVSREASQEEAEVLLCVERALKSSLSDDIKKIMSQRRLEFLEDHGSSITSILSAYDEHQNLLQQEELKREAENGSEDETEEKKPKTETTVVHISAPPVHVSRNPLLPRPINYNTPLPSPVVSAPPYRPMMGPHFRPPPQPFSYGPWYQGYAAYNPAPWNYNRFYHPH